MQDWQSPTRRGEAMRKAMMVPLFALLALGMVSTGCTKKKCRALCAFECAGTIKRTRKFPRKIRKAMFKKCINRCYKAKMAAGYSNKVCGKRYMLEKGRMMSRLRKGFGRVKYKKGYKRGSLALKKALMRLRKKMLKKKMMKRK